MGLVLLPSQPNSSITSKSLESHDGSQDVERTNEEHLPVASHAYVPPTLEPLGSVWQTTGAGGASVNDITSTPNLTV